MCSSSPIKTRIKGVAYEVAFWRSLFAFRSSRDNLYNWSRYARDFQLQNFDVETFLDAEVAAGRTPLVLDVGCGASFSPGNMLHGKPLDIHFIDPLAPFYNKILRRQRPAYFPLVELGAVEHLSAFWPEESVTLIHIQNALDHSRDPLRGIVESMRCLRIGGVLYLKHYTNEAEREAYRGFHQFNVCAEDGQLVVWRPDERQIINELLAGCAQIELSQTALGEVVAVCRKIASVPSALYDDMADRRLLFEQQTATLEAFNGFGFSLKYHILSAFYTIVQTCLRFVPRNLKSKLRKRLKK